MKRLVFVLILLLLMTANVAAQGKGGGETGDEEVYTGGISVECGDGTSFDNGVEITVVQMRPGFNYTATVLGVGDFDPILAIFSGATEEGLCIDDSEEAFAYIAELPTTGEIEASVLNPQLVFNNGNPRDFADVSLIVGGYNNTYGEFIVILEGMAATQADGAGDPFSVRVTDEMIASEVPLTVYAISDTGVLDPLIRLIDTEYTQIIDEDDNPVYCDDAGNDDLCWGESESLDDYYVATNGGEVLLPGYQYDAMLTLPLPEDYAGYYLNFLVTSYQQETFGDYTMVFHVGIAEVEEEEDVDA